MQLGDRAETQRHGDVLQVFFQRYSSKQHAKERTRAAKADKRKSKHNGSGAESGGEGNHASVDDDTDPEGEIWKVGTSELPRGSD